MVMITFKWRICLVSCLLFGLVHAMSLVDDLVQTDDYDSVAGWPMRDVFRRRD